MADLVTHLLLNQLAGQRRLEPVALAWFVSGAVVPDLASRVPRMALLAGLERGVVTASETTRLVLFGLDLPHLPIGLAGVCVVAAALTPRRWLPRKGRPRAGLLLLLGGLLHLGIDVFQAHIEPAYRYLWPLVSTRFELGWIGTESSLVALPFLGALVWWTRPRTQRADLPEEIRPPS